MIDFRVVDLDSQARAVARHIKGWRTADILAWLGQYGELVSFRPDVPNAYWFRSRCGIDTSFMLEPGGVLIIVGDNHAEVILPD
jgi:hypothetical protein